MEPVSTTGEDLVEQRRRRRRAGDPRLSPEGRALFARMTTGDLVEEFQAALDTDVASDLRTIADELGIVVRLIEPDKGPGPVSDRPDAGLLEPPLQSCGLD